MSKYGFMPGTNEENKSNPPVRSKFDKSQGKGLKAPHLSFPGGTAKVTGSSHAGFTENGNMLPKSSSPRGMQNTLRASKPGANLMAGPEPDAVRAGSDNHSAQRNTGTGQVGGKSSSPQRQDNKSTRSKEGAGVLSGGKLR